MEVFVLLIIVYVTVVDNYAVDDYEGNHAVEYCRLHNTTVTGTARANTAIRLLRPGLRQKWKAGSLCTRHWQCAGKCCVNRRHTYIGVCSYEEDQLCISTITNNRLTRNFGSESNLPSGSIGAQPDFIQGYQQPGTPGQGFGQSGGLSGINRLGVYESELRSCRYWCRHPQHQIYCCEGADEPLSAAYTKQGNLPSGSIGAQPGFNQGYQHRGTPGQIGGVVRNNPLGVGASGQRSCRRWCHTPQGQEYCCERADEPLSAVVTKQGQCPLTRPSCHPTRGFAPPKQCFNDGSCDGFDKCCFDTCLQYDTCKPPSGFGK